jgi:hypothetical protein
MGVRNRDYVLLALLFQIDVSDKFCYLTHEEAKLGGGMWVL